MVRFGLIGCGQHAKWALYKAFANARHCQLCAIADLKAENLTAPEVPAEVARYTDYREMFAKESLDAIYVATRVEAHGEPTVDALAAGLHVVCEKPMADTLEKCERMIAAAAAAERLLILDFEKRHYAHCRKIKEWIAAGHLGEIRAVHIQAFDTRKAFGNGAARRLVSMNQNGAMNCGVHDLDVIRYYCGGNWREIVARGQWFGEDTVFPVHQSVLAELDSGVLATLDISAAFGAYVEPPVTAPETLAIVGTKGVIQESAGLVRLTSATLCAEVACEHPPHSIAIAWVLDDVADVLAGRRALADTPLATGHDGLMASFAMLEANRQSIERRATVRKV